MIHLQPLGNNFLCVILALDQTGAAGIAGAAGLRRIQPGIEHLAALGAGPPGRQTVYQYAVADLNPDCQHRRAVLLEYGLQRLRLGNRARIPVQDQTLAAVLAFQTLGDDGVYKLVRPPDSMYSFAFFPSSVSFFRASRSISPVEMWGNFRLSLIRRAWVPLPAPGGPNIIIASLLFFIAYPVINRERKPVNATFPFAFNNQKSVQLLRPRMRPFLRNPS